MEEQKQPPKKATTEEMNVTIALYMGASIENELIYLPEHPEYYKDQELGFKGYSRSLKYHSNWAWLDQVWRMKLCNELDQKRIASIVRSFEVADDIAYTHRLIYEAITRLNQNKGK